MSQIMQQFFLPFTTWYFRLQQTPDFLKSLQEYQTTSGNSGALRFLFYLLLAVFIFFVAWLIYRIALGSNLASRMTVFRAQSRQQLKDLAVKKLTALQATVEQMNVFFKMMGRNDDYNTVITDPVTFEDYLNAYSRVEKDKNKLNIAESLRNTFRFSFSNPDVPFASTHMLPVKQTVRVYLTRGFKRVDYLSIIARNDSNNFAILPPKRNGVWVKMGDLKEVEIRVFREKDSEYQFFCPIKWQSESVVPLIYLGHTNKLIKIFSRYFKRYQLELPCRIARVSEDNLKTTEPVKVMTKDISKGGVALLVPKELLISANDILEITFIDRKNFSTLYGRVIQYNLLDTPQQMILNVEFTGITEVERLLIERFIRQVLETKQQN